MVMVWRSIEKWNARHGNKKYSDSFKYKHEYDVFRLKNQIAAI